MLYPDAQIAEVMERVSNLNTPYAAFYTGDEFVPWESVSMMIYVLLPFCKLLLGVCKQSPISRGVLEEAPPIPPPPKKIFFIKDYLKYL